MAKKLPDEIDQNGTPADKVWRIPEYFVYIALVLALLALWFFVLFR